MLNEDVLKSLYQVDGHPFLISSLYMDVPPDQSPNQLKTHYKGLTDHVRKNLDEKTEEVRDSVREDLEWFQEEIESREEIRSEQTRSVALFSCAAKNYREMFKIPEETTNTCHLTRFPYVRPLSRLIDQSHRTLVICVDRRHARLFDVFINRVVSENSIESDVPDRVRSGGYEGYEGKGISRQVDSEKRVTRHIEEQVDHHLKKTAQLAQTEMQKKNYDFIVLGGHKESMKRFRDRLPSRMEKSIKGTFTCKPEEITRHEALKQVNPIIEEGEKEKEKERLKKLENHRSSDGPVVTGIEEALRAINRGNIRLLVFDDDTSASGNECPFCDNLYTGDQSTCSVCEKLTQPVEDLIDRMIGHTMQRGGSVEHFVSESDFINEHQVCAVLRYT